MRTLKVWRLGMLSVDGLDGRALDLYELLSESLDMVSPAGFIAVEVCRTVQRLDKLHDTLQSDAPWLVLTKNDLGKLVVTVDSALAEARQQQANLVKMLHELGLSTPVRKPVEVASPLAALQAEIAASGGTVVQIGRKR
jgi:hypothetical protein